MPYSGGGGGGGGGGIPFIQNLIIHWLWWFVLYLLNFKNKLVSIFYKFEIKLVLNDNFFCNVLINVSHDTNNVSNVSSRNAKEQNCSINLLCQ